MNLSYTVTNYYGDDVYFFHLLYMCKLFAIDQIAKNR